MLISLTVGKVDAGVAVLLTQDKRLVRTLPAHSNPKQCVAKFTDDQPTDSALLLDRIPIDPASSKYLFW
jgi:hypothetical protein